MGAPLKKRGQYDYGDGEQVTFTWNEIFAEIGKLIANQEFASNHTEMHQVTYDIKKLQETVGQLEESLVEDEPHDHEHRGH